MTGLCCGCTKGQCWLCDFADECHTNDPYNCYYYAPLSLGGITGIAVSCVVVFVFCTMGVYWCRYQRYRYDAYSIPVTVSNVSQFESPYMNQAYPMLSFPISSLDNPYTTYNELNSCQVGNDSLQTEGLPKKQ